MSDTVLISVNGPHGGDSNASRTLDDTRKALKKESEDLNGLNGDDALEVMPGAPGGYLSVELLPEPYGGIKVKTLRSQATVDLPVSMDVPYGKKLLITARGGNGENGGIGGSGQDGKDGLNGAAATEHEDAIHGGNGGKGGDGGAGSNGGIGGNGGTIEIVVNEKDTNLLLATDWNIDPGDGGQPGRNGSPGKGGKGGRGGSGFGWDEVSGFRYTCTPRCRGGGQTDQGFMALVGPRTVTNTTNDRFEVTMNGDIGIRLLGDGRNSSNDRRNLTVAGTTTIPANSGITWEEALVDTVLRTAGQNSSALIPSMPTTLCRCHGGPTHCVGCDREPIMVKQSRARGLDGRDGASGRESSFRPRAGASGIPGSAYITVNHAGGKAETFYSKYKIELVGFQVVDENEDGIVEPGEHIYIQHIQIRNSGGMPTPSSPIPVTVRESKWILPIATSGIFLPTSVQPGHTAYVSGRIKAFIKNDRLELLELGSMFKVADKIRLKAVMPGLNIELPFFEFSYDTEITYPLELIKTQNLDCVPRGLKTAFTWEVRNKSTKEYGLSGGLGRRASTCLSVQPGCGITLMNSTVDGQGKSTKEIDFLAPGETATFSEIAKIDPNVEPYSNTSLIIELLLSSPQADPLALKNEGGVQNTIQEHEHKIQISTRYIFSEGSEFLLVTNSQTSSDTLTGWTRFIEDELGMSLDTWNISLYGGLQFGDDDDTVLSSYIGKTVIMLANTFDYFGKGIRTVLDFCDPTVVATEVLHDTRLEFLVSSSLDSQTINEWMHSLTFPTPYLADNSGNEIEPTALRSKRDMIESIQNQYLSGNQEFASYKIPVKASRILSTKNQLQRKAKRTLRYLLEYLPQERFSIKSTPKDASPGQAGCLIISRGLPHAAQAVIRRQTGPSAIGLAKGGLGLRDSYVCVSALSFCKRVEILCGSPRRVKDQPPKEELIPQGYSQRVVEAAQLSVTHELYQEVHRFLLYSTWLDNLLPRSPSADLQFLRRNFPRLHDFLHHDSVAQSVSPPHEIMQTLTVLLSVTRPQSFKQLAHQILAPMCPRRIRLRGFLMKSIEAVFLKRYSKAAVDEQLELLKNIDKPLMPKKTRDIILSKIGAFTGQSRHEVEFGTGNGNVSSDGFRSEICPEVEWERHKERYNIFLDKLDSDVEHSRAKLEEMIVSS